MGRIERFEDLIAWQKARMLTKEIYQLARRPQFVKDFGLCGQIQRAAVDKQRIESRKGGHKE